MHMQCFPRGNSKGSVVSSRPAGSQHVSIVSPFLYALQTPAPPEDRPQLDAAVAIIDEVNSRDPSKVPVDGVPTPYR